MGFRLFHVTSATGAAAILKEGFADDRGRYSSSSEWQGVWLRDDPGLRPDAGEAILVVDIDLEESALIHEYEWIGERKAYREFLLPAELVNRLAEVRLAPASEPPPATEGSATRSDHDTRR